MANGACVISTLEQYPAKAINDGAILRLGGDGGFDHDQSFIQVDAAFDHRISEVIQDLRLVGAQ